MILIPIVSTRGTTSMRLVWSFIKTNILQMNGSVIGSHRTQMQIPGSIINTITCLQNDQFRGHAHSYELFISADKQ